MKKINLLWVSAWLLSAAFTAAAGSEPVSSLGIANNSDYYWVLNDQDQDAASCKGNCYPVLTPKTSNDIDELSAQWVELWEPNAWMHLGYNVCKNVNYSPDGTALCDAYVGYFSVTFTEDKTDFLPTDGSVTITHAHNFTLFAAEYKPHNPIPAPIQYEKAPFRGNNIAAAEFSSPTIDWIIQYAFPNQKDLTYFAEYGMNTYRFPIRWSYAQPTLMGPLYPAYVDELLTSTQLYLEHGYNVIIDLHSYMRFQPDSTIDPSHEGQVVSAAELTDFWDKLSDALLPLAQKYPEQLMLDLMNEPMKDLSSQAVLDRYNAVLKMLRDKQLNNLVLLEGAHWSGMHSWLSEKDHTGKTNADIFTPAQIIDPANNYAINVHQYFDADHSGTHIPCSNLPTEKINHFLAWAQQHQLRFMVTEFGGADAGNCHGLITAFLNMIHSNEYLLGWTVWAGGRFWDQYPLSTYSRGGAVQLPSVLVREGFLQPSQ